MKQTRKLTDGLQNVYEIGANFEILRNIMRKFDEDKNLLVIWCGANELARK
jgi:hypothetical protein